MNESENNIQTPPQKHSLAIPIAIVLGFAMIAAAILFTNNKPAVPNAAAPTEENRVVDTNTAPTGTLNPITENDHILGNPNAPIMIVEFSDFDCPFCKAFHNTMSRIMSEHGPTGEVAWAYRHHPLPTLHPNAPLLAEASECVADLGGNEAFWKFSDLIFGERDTNEQTDLAKLPDFVETVGVDIESYNSCMESGETKVKVQEDTENATSLGITGTPHSLILIGNQQFPLSGFVEYPEMKGYITSLLEQIKKTQAKSEGT